MTDAEFTFTDGQKAIDSLTSIVREFRPQAVYMAIQDETLPSWSLDGSNNENHEHLLIAPPVIEATIESDGSITLTRQSLTMFYTDPAAKNDVVIDAEMADDKPFSVNSFRQTLMEIFEKLSQSIAA